ncbi:MAG: cytochrome P450, partial [Thermoplasmataceae archaeon]
MNIPSYREEPFLWYKSMRRQNPVLFDRGNAFIFTYGLTKLVLEDFRNYSSQFRDFAAPDVAETLNKYASPSILMLDPPRHTKLRNLVSKAFTPAKVGTYEPEIREIAERLVKTIDSGKVTDIVSAFSYPLPVLVISKLLGVPEDDMELFKRWSDKMATALGRGVDVST